MGTEQLWKKRVHVVSFGSHTSMASVTVAWGDSSEISKSSCTSPAPAQRGCRNTVNLQISQVKTHWRCVPLGLRLALGRSLVCPLTVSARCYRKPVCHEFKITKTAPVHGNKCSSTAHSRRKPQQR